MINDFFLFQNLVSLSVTIGMFLTGEGKNANIVKAERVQIIIKKEKRLCTNLINIPASCTRTTLGWTGSRGLGN